MLIQSMREDRWQEKVVGLIPIIIFSELDRSIASNRHAYIVDAKHPLPKFSVDMKLN